MNRNIFGLLHSFALLACAVLVTSAAASAQACYTAADMDGSTRSSIERSAQQYFAMAMRGDFASLKASAIPAVSSDFSGIEAAITEHQKDLQSGQATSEGVYLLDASVSSGGKSSEFLCGVFNSPDHVTFVIPNLPSGKFAVSIQSIAGGKNPLNFTLILEQSGASWRLAGLQMTPKTINGHDANWYLTQAQSYHQRGQNMVAYMFYYEAWNLSGSVPFQYNAARDKIADQMQSAKPADLPSAKSPLTLSANGKSYQITQMFPEAVGSDLDLIVKYGAVSDISNTGAAFQDNMAVIKGVVTKFPELRQAFGGVVARAVGPNGNDYGTMLAMTQIK